MRYAFVVVAVLLIAVYGFKLYLPTANGVITFQSGFINSQESY